MEDKGFRNCINCIRSINGNFTIPSRQNVADRLPNVAAQARANLYNILQNQCNYYSASSDLWTSRNKDAYISFTIHYLIEDFRMKSWLLEVKHIPGKHTEIAIASE